MQLRFGVLIGVSWLLFYSIGTHEVMENISSIKYLASVAECEHSEIMDQI